MIALHDRTHPATSTANHARTRVNVLIDNADHHRCVGATEANERGGDRHVGAGEEVRDADLDLRQVVVRNRLSEHTRG